MILLTLDTTAN